LRIGDPVWNSRDCIQRHADSLRPCTGRKQTNNAGTDFWSISSGGFLDHTGEIPPWSGAGLHW
jgi:hypothetical protein